MGRRALRPIDPNLDLSRHLKLLEAMPVPWNPAALFGRVAPVEVEVGSGKGLFLAGAAGMQPDHDFLGIEIGRKYARFAAARLAQRSLSNAVVLAGDATEFFAAHIPSAALAAVHVYFPDRWWKARHKKRRVLSEPFLKDVERTLIPGGRFHFWTDVEEYFQTTLALLREQTRLDGPLPVAEPQALHDLDYRTHFERRTRLAGQPVYRAEFRRPE